MVPLFITPSYRPDLELCSFLHRSILEHTEGAHHILVPRRDLAAFARLADARTELVAVEEVLPPGIRQLTTGRWASTWTARPLSGWLVQQIAKLACAALLDAEVVVLVDSDTFLVRDVGLEELAPGGRARLYRDPAGITAQMPDHVRWLQVAAALLGVDAPGTPTADYISSIVTWSPALVRQMLAHVEATGGAPWHRALGRARHVSEYLLYGTYVDRVLRLDSVWHDTDDRCLTWWDLRPMRSDEVDGFVSGLGERDLAVLVSSHSGTSSEVLADVRTAASHRA